MTSLFTPDGCMQSADADADVAPPSQLGLPPPPVANHVGMLPNPPLPRRSGASGAAAPTFPNSGTEPYHVAEMTAIAMHSITAGPAQHVPHSFPPDRNSAKLMPTAWVGQTQPQWVGLPSQNTAAGDHSALQSPPNICPAGHHVAHRAGQGAGARHGPLHTRALSKPLPPQHPSARTPFQPESQHPVMSGQFEAALPAHPPPQFRRPASATRPAGSTERIPSCRGIDHPHADDHAKEVTVYRSVMRSSADQASSHAAEPFHPTNALLPTHDSQLPAARPAARLRQIHASSEANMPRVNAPQRLPAPAWPACAPPDPQPATARDRQPLQTSTAADADRLHHRLATNTEDMAVLARATEPQDIPVSAGVRMPGRRSTKVPSVAAKSIRPALSFGGARQHADGATGAAQRHALAEEAQRHEPPAARASAAQERPSVLTRKVLAQAEQQRERAAAASRAAASDPPSSSRTESVQREEPDEVEDTALSSSTATCSLQSPPTQSRRKVAGITLKHLLDAGLLSAGPQVLHVPLNGGMQAAGVRHDGTVESEGVAVSTIARLFDGDACAPLSEEKAWRLVRYGPWNLRHYRRLFCLDVGALCPIGTLADSPRRAAIDHPFAIGHTSEDQMMMSVAPADEPESQPKARVRVASALAGMSASAAAPVPSLTGVKRTRRQEAVLQATEAEELAEALMKPAKLLASLPMNCLFERGIVRYGTSPPIAVAPAPAGKVAVAKSAGVPVPVVSKPSGTKAAKLVVKPLAKPVAKSATKAAANPVDVAEMELALAKAAAVVAAPVAEPVLQAIDKMQRLPPMPRKVKTLAATMPRAPSAAPSSTAICPVDSQQRSRRDVRPPPRHNGISGLDHTMMQLESYSKLPGEKGIDVQPFAVDVHPAAVAAMDIHAHMCQNEVIGVLGGTYDAGAGRLYVLRAISVQEGLLDVGHTDVEMDAADQSRAVRFPYTFRRLTMSGVRLHSLT